MIIPLIILFLICIIWFIVTCLLYINTNQPVSTLTEIGIPQVTSTSLGKRGNLGNQLFQIACLIGTEQKVVLPTVLKNLKITQLFDLDFEFDDLQQIDHVYHEYDNYEKITIPAINRNFDIRGYRQAFLYFDHVKDVVRNKLVIKKTWLKQMKAVLPDSYIAVHIRKGDYIKPMHSIPMLQEFKRCLNTYYQKGVLTLQEKLGNLPVIICSDDPEWAQTIISGTLAQQPIDPVIADFCTMYLATGLVISNSTFSWWAAYLKDKSVVAPDPWWDPKGFIGTSLGLDGPYLHHPDWIIADAETGEIVTKKKTMKDKETLNVYRLFRGLII